MKPWMERVPWWLIPLSTISILLVAWIVLSAQEARAFERVTGRHISTWDAMWLDLRVQEAAR